jgi:hypothetical protein
VHDSTDGSPPLVTATSYAHAHLGLPTAVTADPGGLALTTATSYEPAGPGAFHRRTARTLPSGAATTYEHYGPAEVVANPCPGGASANQAGLPRRATGPDPDGPGPEVARAARWLLGWAPARGRAPPTTTGAAP